MKNKRSTEKVKTTAPILDPKNPKDSDQEAYQNINRTAFQQNFKILIGHFKITEESPKA